MAKVPNSSHSEAHSQNTTAPKGSHSATASTKPNTTPSGAIWGGQAARHEDAQAQTFRLQQVEQMRRELALRQQQLTSNDFPADFSASAVSSRAMTQSPQKTPIISNEEPESGIYAMFGIENELDTAVPPTFPTQPTSSTPSPLVDTTAQLNQILDDKPEELGLFELFFGAEETPSTQVQTTRNQAKSLELHQCEFATTIESVTQPTSPDSEPKSTSDTTVQVQDIASVQDSQEVHETALITEITENIPVTQLTDSEINATYAVDQGAVDTTKTLSVPTQVASTADLIKAATSRDSADYNADFAALLADNRFNHATIAAPTNVPAPVKSLLTNNTDKYEEEVKEINIEERIQELTKRKTVFAPPIPQDATHSELASTSAFAHINALTAHLSSAEIAQYQLNTDQEIEDTVAQLQAHQSLHDQLITTQESIVDPDFIYSQESIEAATPMMAQYLKIKSEHRDKIMFFRMGDFYEFFFDDAVLTARELSIAVSTRQSHMGKTVPMSGIPYHAYESYAAKLVSKGYSIAICEQISDPKAKGLTERGIVRIITPGTLSQENYLPARESRPLVAIYTNLVQYAVALLDVSSGYLEVSILDNFDAFANRVSQYNPAEILLCQAELQHNELVERFNFKPVSEELFSYRFAIEQIRAIFGREQANELSEQRHVVAVVGALLAYVQQTQMITPTHIQPLKFAHEENLVVMDTATINNLELFKSNTGNRHTSFVEVLDKCNTSMGARLFRRWVRHPTRDQQQLENRLDQVTILLEQEPARKQLQSYLKVIGDIERIVARISLDNCSPRDLGELRNYLLVIPHINRCIIERQLKLELLQTLEPIRNLLLAALEDKQPLFLRDGNVIRSSFNAQLAELRDIHTNIMDRLEELEMQEIEATGIETLTVKKTNMGEIYINIPTGNSANLARIPGYYQHRQTLKNATRYTTPAIRSLEQNYATAELQIASLERELFMQILQALRTELPYLQNLAMQIARLDVFCSFAQLAHEHNYVRPTYNRDHQLEIINGRHPVIELILDQPFIANSSHSNLERSLAIITGPNMGGKSTYMRQNALISLMALIGSYVPASSANIPLFDKVLTRIGASDDLASGKSTFMVEMTEMAHILESATPDSLLLIDEIGRGTSTYDGLSLAWATAQYLAQDIKALTFFSTHYFEMTELAEQLPNVYNLCATAIEHDNNISFLHEIIEGTANHSYGIAVAKLAGVPQQVLHIASTIMDKLHTSATAEYPSQGQTPSITPPSAALKVVDTTSLKTSPALAPEQETVLDTLRKVNPNELTPIRALELLDNLQRLLQGK